MKGDFGNEGSLITNQYGPHWRMSRRLCTMEFFTTSRLDVMRGVRTKCIDQMYIEVTLKGIGLSVYREMFTAGTDTTTSTLKWAMA
ncbi:hypothetical protein RND71_031181 [Anisodus tanguticus]|uniref:Cytochrome P450 n=1 Tax=Anisodus tanguticus TaxID=243964 RepID=A0AAE1RC10_9SOLA|nr:hypothetical protein RND71_031181 [Anisodus tanguticus]